MCVYFFVYYFVIIEACEGIGLLFVCLKENFLIIWLVTDIQTCFQKYKLTVPVFLRLLDVEYHGQLVSIKVIKLESLY